MSRRRSLHALALSVVASLIGVAAAEAQPARTAPDFAALWDEAKRAAQETNAVPEDCVIDFRIDPKTDTLREGHAIACDEPYRSPFYPYPAPSRPGVRLGAEDVRRYARDFAAASLLPGGMKVPPDDALFETCRIVIGFTREGRGAEGIECHWREGGVMGQRMNAGYLVERDDGRRVPSRLHNRITHLKDGAVGEIAERVAANTAAANLNELQVEGKVLRRDGDRLMLWGQARPMFGGSPSVPGVMTSDADLVVEFPSDDALRPGYYFAGEHCFKEQRERVAAGGTKTTEWVYGPCALGRDQYWVFEQYPPGRKTLTHGPYAEYAACDRDRKRAKIGRGVSHVGGHCEKKTKAVLRMTKDGTLVVPKDAPALD